MSRVCRARRLRTRNGRAIKIVWIWSDCPDEPGLHADKNCFRAYHLKLNYSLLATPVEIEFSQ